MCFINKYLKDTQIMKDNSNNLLGCDGLFGIAMILVWKAMSARLVLATHSILKCGICISGWLCLGDRGLLIFKLKETRRFYSTWQQGTAMLAQIFLLWFGAFVTLRTWVGNFKSTIHGVKETDQPIG
jgi:hypothetical protein